MKEGLASAGSSLYNKILIIEFQPELLAEINDEINDLINKLNNELKR